MISIEAAFSPFSLVKKVAMEFSSPRSLFAEFPLSHFIDVESLLSAAEQLAFRSMRSPLFRIMVF